MNFLRQIWCIEYVFGFLIDELLQLLFFMTSMGVIANRAANEEVDANE